MPLSLRFFRFFLFFLEYQINIPLTVTGAARRVGAEIVRTLHAAGWRIALHYRSAAAEAERLASELNARRTASVATFAADLLDTAALPGLIEAAATVWGRLDLLVNDASSFYATPVGQATEAHWDDLVGSNLKAPFFLSQAAAPWLRASGGCIVNIVDLHAGRPMDEHPIYCAAKAGLASLTRSLARELAPPVRVNGIAPGAILWPEHSIDAGERERILGRVPLGRAGSPADIARTVLRYLHQFAANASGLTWVGSLFLLGAAIAMLLTVENAFNQIWNVKRNRPFLKRVGLYLLMLAVGPPALGVSLWATSYVLGVSMGWLGPLPGSIYPNGIFFRRQRYQSAESGYFTVVAEAVVIDILVDFSFQTEKIVEITPEQTLASVKISKSFGSIQGLVLVEIARQAFVERLPVRSLILAEKQARVRIDNNPVAAAGQLADLLAVVFAALQRHAEGAAAGGDLGGGPRCRLPVAFDGLCRLGRKGRKCKCCCNDDGTHSLISPPEMMVLPAAGYGPLRNRQRLRIILRTRKGKMQSACFDPPRAGGKPSVCGCRLTWLRGLW